MTPQRRRDGRKAGPSPAAKFAWFVALWLAGVAAVGSVAFLIRLWIAP